MLTHCFSAVAELLLNKKLNYAFSCSPVTIQKRNRNLRPLNLVYCASIFTHVLRLGPVGGKKAPRRLLRKTTNLFLFKCERETIDHEDFKYSNFEDVAPKPEVLTSLKARQAPSKFQRQAQDIG